MKDEPDTEFAEFRDDEGYAGGVIGDIAFVGGLLLIAVAILARAWFGLVTFGFVVALTALLCTRWPPGRRALRVTLQAVARWFKGRQMLILRGNLAAVRRWFALAFAKRKTDAHVAELMSVTNHLVPTVFSPFRLLFWTTLFVSVASMTWGAFMTFVRLPAVERERDVAREDLATAIDANAKWKGVSNAWEAEAQRARAALAQSGVDQARSLAAAGARSAQNEGIRRRSAARQREILNAGREDSSGGVPFDGGEWLRGRLKAESDRGAGVDAGPAAGAAEGVAAGMLSTGDPDPLGDATNPVQ